MPQRPAGTDGVTQQLLSWPRSGRIHGELQLLCLGEAGLYTLLDGARFPGLPAMLERLRVPHLCLYRGEPRRELAMVAPYLAWAAFGGELLAWILTDARLLESVLFLRCGAPMETLRSHFRRFLYVRDSHGEVRYFRFYDARVMAGLFPAWTPAEQARWMGPVCVTAWLAGSELAVQRHCGLAVAPPNFRELLELSEPQEAALRAGRRERYENQLFSYLRTSYPQQTAAASDEHLRELTDHCLQFGREVGLREARHTSMLAELAVAGAPAELIEQLRQAPAEERPHLLQRAWDAIEQPRAMAASA